MHLGFDTDVFYPVTTQESQQERNHVRSEIGAAPSDILCIYSGKFTAKKNAVILAQAIAQLRAIGLPFRGVFIGEGVQKDALKNFSGSTLMPFMPYRELAPFYRASYIGVWPTDESISTLDAAACGLPLIVSDGIVYREHVQGNGLVYNRTYAVERKIDS